VLSEDTDIVLQFRARECNYFFAAGAKLNKSHLHCVRPQFQNGGKPISQFFSTAVFLPSSIFKRINLILHERKIKLENIG
jgi:hypothetical protein